MEKSYLIDVASVFLYRFDLIITNPTVYYQLSRNLNLTIFQENYNVP